MTTDTDTLSDLFVDVTGSEETTIQREEEPSRDPIEEEEAEIAEAAASAAQNQGLTDAVAGAEADAGDPSAT